MKLCCHPHPFSDKQKNDIKARMKDEFISFDESFEFEKENYVQIINREAFFIKTIIETSKNKQAQMKKVNQILKECNLCYDNDMIINLKGAHSKVYLITKNGKQLVRKEATKENDVKDLQQEIRIMKELKESNYQTSFLLFEYFDENYLDMECATDTLSSYIENNKALSFQDKKKIILDICLIFERFHDIGFLHRDIHPGNLFFFGESSPFLIKLGDFGWSIKKGEVTDDRYRHYSYLNDYQSPEARQSLSYCSEMSEVYSLGKVINYIMRGKPSLTSHEFGAITNKCCLNTASSRYHSVSEVEEAIRDAHAS